MSHIISSQKITGEAYQSWVRDVCKDLPYSLLNRVDHEHFDIGLDYALGCIKNDPKANPFESVMWHTLLCQQMGSSLYDVQEAISQAELAGIGYRSSQSFAYAVYTRLVSGKNPSEYIINNPEKLFDTKIPFFVHRPNRPRFNSLRTWWVKNGGRATVNHFIKD